ncbi:hypothetical protein CHLNCDRAFT_137965 [Chlorella variabilis]|uniref:Autophagy-related protein 13 N-terminal domain-containing protein n=1 Tax=Chlorella variabilis TaxID=554065 RepID=E1Z4Y5_CHLVA|nr:hypothetical protein CHLNCDRAFT_137965 [Chlorella variabilis]EFN59140.1 hypothetical protein CHLNCDRAFT_137965 [Chlorella variabilis]|eukprot:XP_005851242.1 hypothetical protein CHLNCDRAFT_137965 [Chlorella variabilis]
MASSGGPAAPPSLERVVGEAFVKAGQFNLEVDEVEGASKALERWRRETGLPLVLEVFLQPWGAAAGGQPDKAETLLERWVVHYYPMLPEGPSHLSRSQISRLNPSSVYKRLVITLRSLYTYVRVLPAYRMYRACKRQRGSNFTLGYRLHSTLPGAAAAAAPGARRMQSFRFGAVDTPYGQLRIGVDYQPATTVTILEQTTSPPPLPQIIADYVGGPAARGGGSGRAPLRHAMSSAAEGWGAGRGPSPPTPTHARQQRGALASPQAQQQQQQQQAGGSPGGGAERPGGMPIRRSWSASMRGASPHRAPTYPPADLPSPASPHDSPYGSTPQALRAAGGGASAAASPGGGGGGGGGAAREGGASTALIRRPSWSSRSSAFGQLAGEASQQGVGYSDVLPFALDEGSASSPLNPRSPAPPSPPPPPAAASLDQLPVSTPAGGGGSPLAAASRQPAPAAGQGAAPSCGAATAAPAPAPAPAAVPAVDGDAAVGAFVRLIQGAPPLRMQAPRLAGRASSAELSAAAGLRAAPPGTSSGSDSSAATCLSDGRGLTLQAGLRQFSRIRERLQQRGVLVGPWPAEA